MAAMTETKEFTVFGLKLWQQVLVGLVLGILAGSVLGPDALPLKFFGDVFIRLIKLVVAPLIFLALVSGVTSMQESGNVKRVGFKGAGAYLMTASFAVVLGIAMGAIFEPGVGIDPSLVVSMGQALPDAANAAPPTVGKFILDLIPSNIFKAFIEDHYLQVVMFSIFTGITMNLMGEKSRKVREFLYEFAQITFKMIELIVRLAPLAVFGFMAWSVSMMGTDILVTLARLVATVLAACLLQYVIFGILIMVFARLSPIPFYRKMITTQTMAFSTSSSKATLTTAMRELQQKLGVSENTVNFMMPLGACINMDGTAIYLGICALFFSQLYGIPLDFHHYMILILTCTLGSIGAAGIPSGSIIFMGMVLHSVGLPIEGIGLILGVDRILDMFRTTINITGDSTITLLVDKSEKTLDVEKYYS